MADIDSKISLCSQVAYWYRLQIVIDEIGWIFPAIDRPTLRFDGVKRQTPGFRVYPFEPPAIPKTGEYSTSFYDCEGKVVETPKGCAEFELEPVLLISLESGKVFGDFRTKK